MVCVRRLDIKPCTGCFSRWNKTPGHCPQKDDMEQLYFSSARQAGFQLVKNGRMEQGTLENVGRPLCTRREFEEASGGK